MDDHSRAATCPRYTTRVTRSSLLRSLQCAAVGITLRSGRRVEANATPFLSRLPSIIGLVLPLIFALAAHAGTVTASRSGSWSDTALWGGRTPTAADDVVVPPGAIVTLETDAEARSILVYGELRTRPTRVSEYRAAWSKLAESARAGGTELLVHEAAGWRRGDRVVLTPTSRDPREFEERRIVEVWAHDEHAHVVVDAPLAFSHEVVEAPEIDRGHHSGNVRFAGEVLNLTRRLSLRVATEVRVEGGTVALEDLHLDATLQIDNSRRGGVLRRVVGERGQFGQFQTENTQNLLWEECIAYDYTTAPGRGGAGFGWSERTGKNNERANGVWAVRCVAASKRSPGGSLSNGRTKGFFVSGLGGGPGSQNTTARGGIVGSIAVGCPGGTEGAAIRLQENGVMGLQFFWLNEAHSSDRGLYIDGNNMRIFADGLPFVSGFFWRNRVDGMLWGAYKNELEMHHFHFLGNGIDNVKVQTSDAMWSRFVLDGEGVTNNGIRFVGYVVPPHRFAEYVRTRFRNHTAASLSFESPKAAQINRFIDFPAADFSGERVPRTDFCRFATGALPQDRQRHQSPLVGEDVLRLDDVTYRFGACPGEEGAVAPRPWNVPQVDQGTGAGGARKTITAPGSRYTYEAFVARIEEQPLGGVNPVSGEPLIRPLEDWTMVREIELAAPALVPDSSPRRRAARH